MVYIRHRDRMVQESVFNDLKDTLIACRWMAGTTSRPLVSPYDRAAGYQVITTADNQILKMAKGVAVTLVDFFPETSSPEGITGQPEKGHTPPNRMAMDDGQPGDAVPLELGSSLCEIPYRFTIAFWGANVGVCQAVLNDLRDRYRGNAVAGCVVPLYDYNTDPDAATPVLQMEVDNFSYVRAAIEEIEAFELTLYYAQLTVVDVVDDASVGAPLPPAPDPDPDPDPDPPPDTPTFRHVALGDMIDYQSDPTFSSAGGTWTLDPAGTRFFTLLDGVEIGGSYEPISNISTVALDELYLVVSNDGSVIDPALYAAGGYLFLGSGIDPYNGQDFAATYAPYGLVLQLVGVGVAKDRTDPANGIQAVAPIDYLPLPNSDGATYAVDFAFAGPTPPTTWDTGQPLSLTGSTSGEDDPTAVNIIGGKLVASPGSTVALALPPGTTEFYVKLPPEENGVDVIFRSSANGFNVPPDDGDVSIYVASGVPRASFDYRQAGTDQLLTDVAFSPALNVPPTLEDYSVFKITHEGGVFSVTYFTPLDVEAPTPSTLAETVFTDSYPDATMVLDHIYVVANANSVNPVAVWVP